MASLPESSEDYLEMILLLQRQRNPVHAVDIAREFGYSKASVSVAIRKLREAALIESDDPLHIRLTDAGRKIAEEVYARHIFLSEFLIGVGVEPATAAAEACRIEHVISHRTFQLWRESAEK